MKKALVILLFIICLPSIVFGAGISVINNEQLTEIIEKNRGKVVMLNFFASWCPPCRIEMPELVKLRQEIPEDKFFIASLSVEDNAAQVNTFLEQAKVDYPVYMVKKDVTDKFNVNSVPHNVFFSKEGKQVISEPGMAEASIFKNIVDNLLKDN